MRSAAPDVCLSRCATKYHLCTGYKVIWHTCVFMQRRWCCAGMTISCGSLAEELHILHLPTANTLMLEALSSGQPRVVRNTAKFLEVRLVRTRHDLAPVASRPWLHAVLVETRGCFFGHA